MQWFSGLNGEARRETESRLGDKALVLTLNKGCYVARIQPGGYCVPSTRKLDLQDVCLGGDVVGMAPLEWTPTDLYGDAAPPSVARIQKKIEELKARDGNLLEKIESFVDGMLAATETVKRSKIDD